MVIDEYMKHGDRDCVETYEVKACNCEGCCVAATPNLTCDAEIICEDLETSYSEVVINVSASAMSDCHILNGQCGAGWLML